MTRRAARSLGDAGVPLLIVNRTPERGRSLADRYGGEFRQLEDFLRAPPPVSAVLTSVGARPALVSPDVIQRLRRAAEGRLPLVVDLAVPPDSDAEACHQAGLPRLDLDAVVREVERNRSARLRQAAAAREEVDAALWELREKATEGMYRPLFAALQRRYRRTVEQTLRPLLSRDLKGLSDVEVQALNRWAGSLAQRFAHIPTKGLRGLLHNGPQGSVAAFLDSLEPEFATELREAMESSHSSAKTGESQ